MDREKLIKLLLNKDKETRNLAQNIYLSNYSNKEDTSDLAEIYKESLNMDIIIGRGLYEQITSTNVHIYDPSRFTTITINKWL